MSSLRIQSIPVSGSSDTYTVTVDSQSFTFSEAQAVNVELFASSVAITRTGTFTDYSETLQESRSLLISSGVVRSFPALAAADGYWLAVFFAAVAVVLYVFRRL